MAVEGWMDGQAEPVPHVKEQSGARLTDQCDQKESGHGCQGGTAWFM